MHIKVRDSFLGLCKTQIPSYIIIIHAWGHDFPRHPPLPTNLLGVRFWFELTQGNSIFPMPLLRFFSSNTHYVHNVIFWKFLAFISLATWCGTFVQFPPPLKGSWCPHHNVHFLCFFVSLLWNSYMASWACSMPNAFTQDAFIIWYIFHLTKYSYSHPLIALIWAKPPLETHVHY
jgi:hypothetical protein